MKKTKEKGNRTKEMKGKGRKGKRNKEDEEKGKKHYTFIGNNR
jgi:hypothetical protein